MGDKFPTFDRVRIFRGTSGGSVDDLEGAIDVIQKSPHIVRRHLQQVEDLLFVAIQSQHEADVTAARNAFIATMRTEGWLR